jgi:ribosomal protein S18 acetylase RimI-like enzyme
MNPAVLRTVEDRDDAAEARRAVGELLAAAFAEAPYHRSADSVEGMLKRFDRHARKPGFRLVLAEDRGRPVGLGYGFRLSAASRWWDETLDPVTPQMAAEDGQRSFAVYELAVDPGRRREHLAERIHAALLADRPESRVVLNVHHDAEAAQAAYAKWGYCKVARVVPWTHAPVYDVMVLDLESDRER